MNIGVLCGYWSTNIGNSFFQLGAEYVLKRAFAGHDLFFVGDQAGYAYPKSGRPANALDLLRYIDVDYLAVLGPFIRPEFEKILGPTLRALSARGTRIIALSVGLMDYKLDAKRYRELLKGIDFFCFFSRDHHTYTELGDLAVNSYDGIDAAFFISDAVRRKPFSKDMGDYWAVNFDQAPEPRIETASFPGAQRFAIANGELYMDMKAFRKESILRNMGRRVLRSTLRSTSEIGGARIIRTDHRYNPYIERKIYSGSNTYSGDVPFSYLQIYANAKGVISNRVHACVAALSYGVPAFLASGSERSKLFDRINARMIKERFVHSSELPLEREKEKMLSELQRLASLI